MQRTRFGDMTCSIARTLDIAGEPWSPLILRDVWVGINRFDDLQQELGISRKVLAERLKWLVGKGMLARRTYLERPQRYEYVLTEKGTQFCDVLLAITAWGDRWTAAKAGPPVLVRHHHCGQLTHAEIRCARCGHPLHASEVDIQPGPGSSPSEERSAHSC
jgi:DNA-binding HxlR family transcriptional regulator